MEFEDDDHEQEEEEEEEDDDDDDEGTTIPPSAPSAAATTSLAVPHTSTGASRYRECQKNHAVSIGGHAVDGCGEFMPAGEDGTLNALKCAACGCHRNFHRKETDSSSAAPSLDLAGAAASSSAAAAAAAAFYQPQFPHHPAYYRATPAPPPPGYLQHPHRPLALPSTTPEMEELSNPSSSGGGKKRFRTKFTAEQKERMVEFAERIGWRITKQDEAAVEQFCSELRLSRQVLKVWLHNNKHTLGRKP